MTRDWVRNWLVIRRRPVGAIPARQTLIAAFVACMASILTAPPVCVGALNAATLAQGAECAQPDDAKFDRAIDEAYAAWQAKDWAKAKDA